MSHATILTLAVLLATAFAGCADDGKEPPISSAPASTCTFPERSTLTLENASNPIVVWDTSLGCFGAEMFVHSNPITAGNFVNLTKSGFYNGTRFHRVIEGFMIQDGDPLSKDTSKRSLWGTGKDTSIKDEFACKDGTRSLTYPANCTNHGGLRYKHDRVGRISMANTGQPNSGGSQYFVVIQPGSGGFPTHLDGKHPIFAQVVWNQATVEKIGKTPTNQDDQPLTDVVNKSLTIH
jgi:cyclophilin family peptidyl-prolyl cis-trans isomerase